MDIDDIKHRHIQTNGIEMHIAVTASVALGSVYVGSLVETIDQTSFTQCTSPGLCSISTATAKDEYTNLRFVLQPNGGFVASGTVTHSVRSEQTTNDGCDAIVTETGTGTVTDFSGTIANPKGEIRASVTVTRTTSSIACRGSPATGDTSTSTTTFVTSNDFLTPIFDGSTLVELVWNGSVTDNTNTTFGQQGDVKLVP